MRMRLSALGLAPLISFAVGCGAETSGPAEIPIHVTDVPRATADPLPPHHPEMNGLTVASRGPRRLSVEELERSWEVVTGLPSGAVQLPEFLARSLGDPDWLSVTEPALEPSPLFMKFAVDLANILCSQVLSAEVQQPAQTRVLLRHPEDVERNLRQLILRFWAIDASEAGHSDVIRLRTVYDAGSEGQFGVYSGWLAVCVALTTAPEFLLY